MRRHEHSTIIITKFFRELRKRYGTRSMKKEVKKALDEYEKEEAPEREDWKIAAHNNCSLCGFMHIDPELTPEYCPCRNCV